MSEQPTVLEIVRLSESQFRFCLRRAGELFAGPIQQVWDVSVDVTALASLRTRIHQTVERAASHPEESDAIPAEFATLGGGLCDEFFSTRDPRLQDLRRQLRELNAPLLVSTDAPDIPWELLYDPEAWTDPAGPLASGFLGLRCDVGRRLIRRGVPPTLPRRGEGWRCLLIADPNQDDPEWALPESGLEAAKLRMWLTGKNVNCDDYLVGTSATFEAVFSKLLRPYDIIHFSGHCVLDPTTGEYGLKLNGGKLLAASTIRKHVKGAPMVFLNGCESGKAIEGLTDAFLESGAQLVVGSLFPVPDEGARTIAERFYEVALDGKPVGEAMRLAREHAMGDPACGAAWASFALYGDPTLRIEIRSDDLQRLLLPIGLGRRDLGASCCRVLEQALEYGRPSRLLGTPHLFAAIIGGEDSHVRDRLREQQVPPEKLRDAFADAFGHAEADDGAPPDPKLSDNVQTILHAAQSRAQDDGRDRIAELDLVKAFVEHRGGTTGAILAALGIDVEALDPDRSATTTLPAMDRVGPLRCGDCSPEAWQALLHSVDAARRSGSLQVATPHLFFGMLQSDSGELAAAIARFQIDAAQLRRKLAAALRIVGSPQASASSGDPVIECSANTGAVLTFSQALAIAGGRRVIGDGDLLVAFTRQGGGQMGQWLGQQGLVLEALTSEAFLDDGQLCLARFDDAARHIVERALECAHQKLQAALGRRHLLYALLLSQHGLLAGLLARQGKDAEQLADLLYTTMPAGQAANAALEARVTDCSPGLVRVICAAEAAAKDRRHELIGEEELLHASLIDGGGEAGQFLVLHGVRWSSLL